MSIEVSVQGGRRSIDVSYGYWNEFANWVADVRPRATSILHKAPYVGGWTPDKLDKATTDWQRLDSLIRDLNALAEVDGHEEHDWLIGELSTFAAEAKDRGKAVMLA